ncbi:MAG: redox-regulated ATPase YchF [Bacteroidota bacterium]
MGLKCGIVGLPNVGKSTLFNCLTNAKAQAANFPFCTIEPNLGVITVPDERLNKLAELVHPQKIIPTTVEIVDIAGLVKGASKGEGLGNQFLGNIRETNAIIHVLRCFDDTNVVHVDGSVNPVRDKEVVDVELQLKDLETVEKNISQYKNKAKTSGDKEAKKLVDILSKYQNHLSEGKSIRSLKIGKEEKALVADMQLLTDKPVLYLCNVHINPPHSNMKGKKGEDEYVEQIKKIVAGENAEVIMIDTQQEVEIAQLENYEDRKTFLSDLGLDEPGVNKLIRSAYKILNLQTFITAGEKEVKAWTIEKGMKAPQAAGVIHTDFEKGFIRAEVIKYNDYITLRSESACRDAGKLAMEGKEYIVQDGDVMHFRFNV